MIELNKLVQLSQTEGDKSYASFISNFGFDFFVKRVKSLGLMGFDNVLDIGCGFGQWALALSYFNMNVSAIDAVESRIDIGKKLAKDVGITNVDFECGMWDAAKYEDNSVDLIVCYGVMMSLNRRQFEKDIYRILRPGGRAYICTNDKGWWIRLIAKNLFSNHRVAFFSFKALLNSSREGYPNSTSFKKFFNVFDDKKWGIYGPTHEGHLSTSEVNNEVCQSYSPKFLGFIQVIEGIIVKRPFQSESKDFIEFEVMELVEKTLSKQNYHYLLELRNQINIYVPKSDKFINQMNLLRKITRIKRSQILKAIFTRVTQEAQSQKDQLLQLMFFCQKHFTHSFIGQPISYDKDSILDPIVVFLLANVRCGNMARFIVDICLVNGIDARLVTLGGHTMAEVRVDNKWRIMDPDIYFYQNYPKTIHGEWACLEDAIATPTILDTPVNNIEYFEKNNQFIIENLTPDETDTPFVQMSNPLYPSSAYFSKKLFGERAIEAIAYTKNGTPEQWDESMEFGWKNIVISERFNLPEVAFEFKPPQITNIEFRDNQLHFTLSENKALKEDEFIEYFVSDKSRGWEQSNIPFSAELPIEGASHRSPNLAVDFSKPNNQVTYITAFVKKTQYKDAFHLPSEEFVIDIA